MNNVLWAVGRKINVNLVVLQDEEAALVEIPSDDTARVLLLREDERHVASYSVCRSSAERGLRADRVLAVDDQVRHRLDGALRTKTGHHLQVADRRFDSLDVVEPRRHEHDVLVADPCPRADVVHSDPTE